MVKQLNRNSKLKKKMMMKNMMNSQKKIRSWIELQLRKLAKATFGHGIKSMIDSIVTALAY